MERPCQDARPEQRSLTSSQPPSALLSQPSTNFTELLHQSNLQSPSLISEPIEPKRTEPVAGVGEVFYTVTPQHSVGDGVGASASAVMGLCLYIAQDHALNSAKLTLKS